MIFLLKQLVDDKCAVQQVALCSNALEHVEQIVDLEADAIIGTCAEDSQLVLELAQITKISFALYQPDISQVSQLLESFAVAPYRYVSKLIYFSPEEYVISAHHKSLLKIKDHTKIVFDGDYLSQCEDMIFFDTACGDLLLSSESAQQLISVM
jgi:hypothetical protein